MFATSTKIAVLTALTMAAILLASAGIAQAQQSPPAPPAGNGAPGAVANQQPNPVVGQLLNQIQFASNEDARSSAANELAKINDPRTLLVLIQAAVYDSEDSVRLAARSAALKVSNGAAPRRAVEIGKDPVGVLMTQVLDAKDADQRRQAAKDLARSTDAHALAALEIAAVFDRDDTVRDVARKAAVQIWQSMSLADPASGSTAGPTAPITASSTAAPAAPTAPANPATPGQPGQVVAQAPAVQPGQPVQPVQPAQPVQPVPAPQVIYPPATTNPPVSLQPAPEIPAAPAGPAPQVTPVAPATPAVPVAPTITPAAPVAAAPSGDALLNVPQAQAPAPGAQPAPPPPGYAPNAGPGYVAAAPGAVVAPPVVAPPPATLVVVRRGAAYYYYCPATGCYYAYPPAYYYQPAVVYSPAPPQFSLGVNLGFVFGHFHRH